MFDSRASLPNEVKADIEQFLSDARGTNSAWAEAMILPTFIRRNIKLAEAPSYGKTIFEYEQNCHGAEDYAKVAQFVHARFQAPVETETPAPVASEEAREEPDCLEPSVAQTQPSDADENQDQTPAVDDVLSQPDQQTPAEPGTEPLPAADVSRSQPTFEIKSIPWQNSQRPTNYPQTTDEPEQAAETEHTGF